MYCKQMLLIAALITGVANSTVAYAQPDESEYAQDHIIVKVHPGIMPLPVDNVGMGLRYVTEPDLPPDVVEVAELLMAVIMQVSTVTLIEPMINFPFADPERAAQFGLDRFYIISVPIGTDIADLVEQLSPFDTHLELVSLDWYGKFSGSPPDDPLFTDQWYLNNTGQPLQTPCPFCICLPLPPNGTPDADIDCLEAWTLETGNSDIVTAVIDTGADLDHPDLVNQLVPGHNFVDGEDPDVPQEGPVSHGTLIAGLIAAEEGNSQGIVGVSRESRVMPLKIANGVPDMANINQALQWAIDAPDVRIVSLSFGGDPARWEPVIGPFIQAALDDEIVIVASAGNEATFPINYPASDPDVIGVTATDWEDNFTCFSNFGDGSHGAGPSVAAPGQDIVSTHNPDALIGCVDEFYCREWGTSFSTPIVAGVASLILSANDTLTNVEVKQIIEDTADDLGDPGFDNEFGHGRINAYVAVCTARSMLCLGDIDGDCIVSVSDLLALLANWGVDKPGPADLDCDYDVGTSDLLTLLANWGRCECSGPGPEPPTLEQELADACLSQENWDDYVDVMTDPASSQEDKDRYQCWMEHYIYDCNRCFCVGASGCPNPDPFN